MIINMIVITMPPVRQMARPRGGIPVMILWIIWLWITAISYSLITARDIRVSCSSNIIVPHTIEDILCSEPLTTSALTYPLLFQSVRYLADVWRISEIHCLPFHPKLVRCHVLSVLHIIVTGPPEYHPFRWFLFVVHFLLPRYSYRCVCSQLCRLGMLSAFLCHVGSNHANHTLLDKYFCQTP